MKKKKKENKFKDILVRAFKTFIQAFLSSLVVFINTNQNIDEKVLKSALMGALAGGISAVMNLIIKMLNK